MVKVVNIKMDFNVKVNVSVKKDGKWYVAKDKITNVATQAKTRKQALNRLDEALSLYYEDFIPHKISNLNLENYVGRIKEARKNAALRPTIGT